MGVEFKETSFSPFPLEMKGRFYELESSGRTQFFEIYNEEYNLELISRLKKMKSLEDSPLGILIKLVGKENIPAQTVQLYKLLTYFANPNLSDSWEFNDSIKDYREIGFCSYKKLENYCLRNWSVDVMNFVPIEETNIPG
jgi:hypothetical protein